jgi:hypothetical protein
MNPHQPNKTLQHTTYKKQTQQYSVHNPFTPSRTHLGRELVLLLHREVCVLYSSPVLNRIQSAQVIQQRLHPRIVVVAMVLRSVRTLLARLPVATARGTRSKNTERRRQ